MGEFALDPFEVSKARAIGEFVKHAGWCNAGQFDENKTHEGGNSNSLNYKW